MKDKPVLRLGRINFLNVLPIYHALEAGILPHEFEIVSGTPAFLNNLMAAGQLHMSSCSCFEYASRPDRYFIVPNLSIGSRGPVMSVLLLSRTPIEQLAGHEILISGQSHTSVALLRILMRALYHIPVTYKVGNITLELSGHQPPKAFLAIGDEALRLRNAEDYPYMIDLAEAWREWTGLPFIFGLWVISADAIKKGYFQPDPGKILRDGMEWGMRHIDTIINLTAHGCPLSKEDLFTYYTQGLLYTLGEEELTGLKLFYKKLVENRLIEKMPQLKFY